MVAVDVTSKAIRARRDRVMGPVNLPAAKSCRKSIRSLRMLA